MRSTFARRLQLVTTLEIAAVFGMLVIAGALLALAAYVGTLRGDLATTLDRVVGALGSPARVSDARRAGEAAASRYPRSDVVVVLIDEKRRVAVYQPADRSARPVVDDRPRGVVGSEPTAKGPFASIVFGLVTAFGTQIARAHVGSVDVVVKPNEAVLVATVGAYVPEFVVALALALGIAIVLARAIVRQSLRPLTDVTGALERFAAGDLTPQPIVADRRHELGSLAVAYNGAIAQMERAFAERDRANESMRQFIADAGHQLRTPLTVVRGFISILRKGDLRSPADGERILETMYRQSQIMGALIDKLMLLDRWETPPPEEPPEAIDVAQLARDVVSPIAESHPDRTIAIDAPDAGLAAIDPTSLGHALTNLVDNALKYTAGDVAVVVRRRGERVVIDVADAGPGLSPADASHAFDRFFRGSRRDVEGSGLGLAIAKRAIERAGGTVTLETDPASGSHFRIDLRAARLPPAKRDGPLPPPPLVPGGSDDAAGDAADEGVSRSRAGRV